MISIIAPTAAAVSGVTTEFSPAGPFILHGSLFNGTESAKLERLGPSGQYETLTNSAGPVQIGQAPNSIYVDLPAGTYRINKTVTVTTASVGYEVV